jgi:hypothetical protein
VVVVKSLNLTLARLKWVKEELVNAVGKRSLPIRCSADGLQVSTQSKQCCTNKSTVQIQMSSRATAQQRHQMPAIVIRNSGQIERRKIVF